MPKILKTAQLHDIVFKAPDMLSVQTASETTDLTDARSAGLDETGEVAVSATLWIDDEGVLDALAEIFSAESWTCLDFYDGEEHWLVNLNNISIDEEAGFADFIASAGIELSDAGQMKQLTYDGLKIETSWDEYGTEDFDDQDATDNMPNAILTLADFYDLGAGDYALRLNATNEHWDFGYHWMNTFTLTWQFRQASGSSSTWASYMFWRYNSAASSYSLYVNDDPLKITVRRGTTNLRVLQTKDAFDTAVFHTIKLEVQGSRIDIYWNGECLTKKNPIIDPTFNSGYIRFTAADTQTIYINNVTFEVLKPVAILLPPNAAELNRFRDCTIEGDDGNMHKLISARQPINFDEKTVTPSNLPGGNEVKFTVSGKRYYDISHELNAEFVISNGLVRLTVNPTLSNPNFKLGCYDTIADTWVDIEFIPAWSGLTISKHAYIILKLERYVAVLREVTFYKTARIYDTIWTDYTIRSGSPLVRIENKRTM